MRTITAILAIVVAFTFVATAHAQQDQKAKSSANASVNTETQPPSPGDAIASHREAFFARIKERANENMKTSAKDAAK